MNSPHIPTVLVSRLVKVTIEDSTQTTDEVRAKPSQVHKSLVEYRQIELISVRHQANPFLSMITNRVADSCGLNFLARLESN